MVGSVNTNFAYEWTNYWPRFFCTSSLPCYVRSFMTHKAHLIFEIMLYIAFSKVFYRVKFMPKFLICIMIYKHIEKKRRTRKYSSLSIAVSHPIENSGTKTALKPSLEFPLLLSFISLSYLD